MKRIKSFIKPFFLSVFLLASGAAQADTISGIWSGTAIDINPDEGYFDHGVNISIASSAQNGPNRSKWTYVPNPNLPETICRSTLDFESVLGNVWTFNDLPDADSPCLSGGKVVLTYMPVGRGDTIFFQWLFSNGEVDTEGFIHRSQLQLP